MSYKKITENKSWLSRNYGDVWKTTIILLFVIFVLSFIYIGAISVYKSTYNSEIDYHGTITDIRGNRFLLVHLQEGGDISIIVECDYYRVGDKILVHVQWNSNVWSIRDDPCKK